MELWRGKVTHCQSNLYVLLLVAPDQIYSLAEYGQSPPVGNAKACYVQVC
jgi:hypothetical protein